MGFTVLFGEDVDEAFLAKLDRIDEACYEPKYWGELENTLLRFRKNPRQFVFVLDEATDELAGYINFFPCEQGLYEDNLFASPVIRDDDITPDEVAPYRTDANHLFIISLCVHPDYQGGEAIKLLSNSFIDYLNQLQDEGYPITDIMGTAVSEDGRKAMGNYLFHEVRTLADSDVVSICDGKNLENLLAHKLYFKSYRDDIYLMLPMAEHTANLRVDNYFDDLANGAHSKHASKDAAIAESLIEGLRTFINYECSNEVAREIEFAYLGSYDFLHTTDEYAGEDGDAEIVTGLARGHAVLAAHRKTHMFVLTVMLPDYPFSSTQMEDQVSYGYLKIRDPKGGDGFVPFYDYLLNEFGLHECGQAKCVLYMSNKPNDEREMQDILAAEAYDNYNNPYKLASSEIEKLCRRNRAQFDGYEVYLSSRAIAYVDEDFSPSLQERIEEFSDYLFIVVMTLFQNTALAKVNKRVTRILENDSDIAPKTKLAIDQEYGQTIKFWEMQNFRYLATQMEATCIKEAFLNAELRATYDEHQAYLEHLVSVKSAITETRNGMIINVVAVILAVIQLQPFFIEILQDVYGALGIEATYAASTFNYGMFGGLALFIIVVIIAHRRRSYLQRRNM